MTALIATAHKTSWTARRVETVDSLGQLVAEIAEVVTGGDATPQQDGENLHETELANIEQITAESRIAALTKLASTNWRSISATQSGKAVKNAKAVKNVGLAVAGKDADETVYGPRNSGDADFMLYLTPERITAHVRNNGKWVRVASGDYAKVAAVLNTAADGEPTDEQATA